MEITTQMNRDMAIAALTLAKIIEDSILAQMFQVEDLSEKQRVQMRLAARAASNNAVQCLASFQESVEDVQESVERG